MQCVIVAGGKGTKMHAISKKLPKSLIPIHHRPFLHYQLSHLARQGIRNILLCVGHGADPIVRYAEDGRAWGLTIQYVKEGKDLQGTGGALRLAYEQNRLEPIFFVLSGDSFPPIDFLPAWNYFETRIEPALLVVSKSKGKSERPHALFDGQKITRYEKKRTAAMTDVDGGLSILRPDAIAQGIPPNSVYALEDLFHRLSERGKLAGFETETPFYNIGTPEGLAEFTASVSEMPL